MRKRRQKTSEIYRGFSCAYFIWREQGQLAEPAAWDDFAKRRVRERSVDKEEEMREQVCIFHLAVCVEEISRDRGNKTDVWWKNA